MSRLLLSPLVAATLLFGCATPPAPLTADHPASSSAAEGARPERRASLRADALTRKSRALIIAAEKEQEEPSKNESSPGKPDSGTAPPTPGAMPGMNHNQMKGMGQ